MYLIYMITIQIEFTSILINIYSNTNNKKKIIILTNNYTTVNNETTVIGAPSTVL